MNRFVALSALNRSITSALTMLALLLATLGCEPAPSAQPSSLAIASPDASADATGGPSEPSASPAPPSQPPDPTPQPFDPAPWRQIADLSRPRADHTATVLRDGRVLVAGGRGRGSTLATTELFDPATGTWSSAAQMRRARANHVAVRLPDGRVLVTGGFDWDTRPYATSLRSTEIYDPTADTWTRVAPAPGSADGDAILLSDGRVVILVGVARAGGAVSILTAFDPVSGSWGRVARLPERRGLPTVTRLSGRDFLITGGSLPIGEGPPTSERDAWRYDAATDTWITLPRMRDHGFGHSATRLSDGRVLIVGGRRPELFDPSTNSWLAAGETSDVDRDSHQAVTLLDGRVLVVGRSSCRSNNDNKLAEIFDPVAGTWRDAGRLPYESSRSTAVLLDGRVLVTGGTTSCPIDRRDDSGPYSDVFILDPADLP